MNDLEQKIANLQNLLSREIASHAITKEISKIRNSVNGAENLATILSEGLKGARDNKGNVLLTKQTGNQAAHFTPKELIFDFLSNPANEYWLRPGSDIAPKKEKPKQDDSFDRDSFHDPAFRKKALEAIKTGGTIFSG